ncbi:hypothetical protein MXB_1678, partial [Myxobolus squamalis]
MTKYYRYMHYDSKSCTARPIVSENKGNLQVGASKYIIVTRLSLSIPVDRNNNSIKKKISNQILYNRSNETNRSHYEF